MAGGEVVLTLFFFFFFFNPPDIKYCHIVKSAVSQKVTFDFDNVMHKLWQNWTQFGGKHLRKKDWMVMEYMKHLFGFWVWLWKVCFPPLLASEQKKKTKSVSGESMVNVILSTLRQWLDMFTFIWFYIRDANRCFASTITPRRAVSVLSNPAMSQAKH